MNIRLRTGLAAIVCMSFASCYPYQEHPRYPKNRKAPDTPAAAQEMKKKTEEEMRKNKAEEDMKRKQAQEQAATEPKPEDPGTVSPPSETTSKPAEPKNDFPFANKVPGKDGFVFSPYNSKVVDVRDIPSGTLVQDPTFPASEKKYFRVP